MICILSEEGMEHGRKFRRSSAVKGDIRSVLASFLASLNEKGYDVTASEEDERFWRVTGDDHTDYTVCAYQTEELQIEPYIMSVFYHLRNNLYVEVMRDTPNQQVIVYLYPAGIPGGKEEVARTKMGPETPDDDILIAGVLVKIEDIAKDYE